jgi:probable H4MPT-linked C1 transfer pathway protein
MAHSVLGLDIGGANLKAAHTDGAARLVPFALWKQPQNLADELRRLTASMPHFDYLAVTMTGELCDCFESSGQGVRAILDAVRSAAPSAKILVWTNDGRFTTLTGAKSTPLRVAAANWLALATYAGRFAPDGPALLLDIGSSTTDIVPLLDGKPLPLGRTDPERLRFGELVYTGVRRTPLCALLGEYSAAELFATTLDVYLVLDAIGEDEHDLGTADGRPATKAAAHRRLARMLCADVETTTEQERLGLARLARTVQRDKITSGIRQVIERMGKRPAAYVLSGCGEFLAHSIVWPSSTSSNTVLTSLRNKLGAAVSQAAPAFALALLAAELGNAMH